MAKKGIKGITIELDGNAAGLDKALRDVNSKSRDLQGELRQVERLLKFDPGNTELLAQQQQILSEQVENTTEKLNRLKRAQSQVEDQFKSGKIGADQYRAFQRELTATEGQLDGLKRKLDNVGDSKGADRAKRGVRELGDEADRTDGKLSNMGSGFSSAMKGIGGAAVAGAGAIGGLVFGMDDYNRELARLRTNAHNAGFEMDGVKEGFQKIAAVSGETDSAVETISNLMQTGFSDQQMAQAIDEINGAAIRFSDTLKTEGIADGLQETFATGEAIGQFGELLERSGVDLDTFNAGLAEAQKQGSETDYVLQQLADLGLSSAYDEYKQLNPEIVEQQEAQQRLNMAMSELSVALTPLVTMVVEFATALVGWINNTRDALSGFESLSEGLQTMLPQMWETGMNFILNFLNGILEALPGLFETIQGLIPQATAMMQTYLPQVLDMGIEILLALINGIINTLPSLINMAISLISTLVQTLIRNLPKIIDSGVKILKSLINGIVKTLPNLIKTALELIIQIASTLIKNLPKIIDAGIQILTSLIEGIVSMAGTLGSSILTDIIPKIVETLKGVDLFQIGKDIIQGLINGVGSMAKAVWNKAKSIADGIGESIRKTLDSKSPSRVTMDIGEDAGEGLVIGLENMINSIKKASHHMAQASIPKIPSSQQLKNQTPVTSGLNLNIAPAPVILDKQTVGEIIYKVVDEMNQRNILRSRRFGGDPLG